MNDTWTDRWNERFSANEFVYGETPNQFLEEHLQTLLPGSILFPAEGEGRNAVYAASLGWKVSAFDISTEGRKKAMRLAASKNVTIDYQVGTLDTLDYKHGQFDVIALIYAHFPADIKSQYHKELSALLRSGGVVIFEAFSKKHPEYQATNPSVGGPKELAMLFSVEEIEADFAGYEVLMLEERAIELREGAFHQGVGSVIRFVGRKL
ncbi:MAG: class I SAM-dependent methyltransferase [Ignavibacteria bacterium]|nr:class I SAM-dependent methyltransferase [Ignavibacteria bacterium]